MVGSNKGIKLSLLMLKKEKGGTGKLLLMRQAKIKKDPKCERWTAQREHRMKKVMETHVGLEGCVCAFLLVKF